MELEEAAVRAIVRTARTDHHMLLYFAATTLGLIAWARPAPAGETCPWVDGFQGLRALPDRPAAPVSSPAVLRFLEPGAKPTSRSGNGSHDSGAWSRLPPGRLGGSPGTRL